MVQAVNIGALLGSLGQLQQVNAENRRRREAKDDARRSGISALTTTAGTIIGGVYGGPVGAAAGGAIGGAVGGFVGGKPMTQQQGAAHALQIGGAYASQQAQPVRYGYKTEKLGSGTITKEVGYNKFNDVVSSKVVPASSIQQPDQPESVMQPRTVTLEGGGKLTLLGNKVVPASSVQQPEQPATPSVPLQVAAQSVSDLIVNQAGGMPALTQENQADLDRVNRLSQVTGKGIDQAQKQISAIQKKYTPPELKPTVESVYVGGKKKKALYDPMSDTFKFGKKTVPASEVSLEKDQPGDWRPQKMLVKNKEGKFEPSLISYNPDTQQYKMGGREVSSDNVKPIPTGSSTRVYDPNTGSLIMEQSSGGGITTPVKTKIQKEIAENRVTLSSLDNLSQMYDEKFLQLPEQLQVGGLKVLEKAGIQLSPENQKRIEDMSAFQAQTVDIAAKYIKQISGVAVSEAEAKRLRKVLPQAGDSPTEFKSKMNTAMTRLRKINLVYESILNGDLPKTKTDSKESVQDYLDRGTISPDALNRIGDRLKVKNNWSDAQVGRFLAESGMI